MKKMSTYNIALILSSLTTLVSLGIIAAMWLNPAAFLRPGLGGGDGLHFIASFVFVRTLALSIVFFYLVIVQTVIAVLPYNIHSSFGFVFLVVGPNTFPNPFLRILSRLVPDLSLI